MDGNYRRLIIRRIVGDYVCLHRIRTSGALISGCFQPLSAVCAMHLLNKWLMGRRDTGLPRRAPCSVRENVCNNSKKRKKSCFFGFWRAT